MRINPIHQTPNISYKGKITKNIIPKEPTKSQQFWEATGVVAMTSIPMFLFIYLQNLFKKTFGNKNKCEWELTNCTMYSTIIIC